MSRHRFLDLVQPEPTLSSAGLPAGNASGFMVCPLVLQAGAWAWQQQVYQWAFEQAQAVVRPSRLERWQVATPN
jgi:hypothetical protein